MSRCIPLALVLLVALAGCDSAPVSDADDAGVFEGTYTLPDGTTGSFRTRATAGAVYYTGIGTRDGFQFGTAFEGPPAPGVIGVSVGFSQETLVPASGAYSPGFDDPERRHIQSIFTLANVPGLNARDLLDPSTAIVSFPRGTVDVRVVGRTLSGTFDLRGQPFGVADSVEVRVVGRFEMPYEPGKPSSQRR